MAIKLRRKRAGGWDIISKKPMADGITKSPSYRRHGQWPVTSSYLMGYWYPGIGEIDPWKVKMI